MFPFLVFFFSRSVFIVLIPSLSLSGFHIFIYFLLSFSWLNHHRKTFWKQPKKKNTPRRETDNANNYHKCANNSLKCIFHSVAIFIISILNNSTVLRSGFSSIFFPLLFPLVHLLIPCGMSCSLFIFALLRWPNGFAHLFCIDFGTQFFIFINLRSQHIFSFRWEKYMRKAFLKKKRKKLLPIQLLFLYLPFLISRWWQQFISSIFIEKKNDTCSTMQTKVLICGSFDALMATSFFVSW